MSSVVRRAPTASIDVRPFSAEEHELLLESAVLDAYGEMGVPLSDEAEGVFASRVDVLYWTYLAAHGRASVGPSTWFQRQARAMAEHARRRGT